MVFSLPHKRHYLLRGDYQKLQAFEMKRLNLHVLDWQLIIVFKCSYDFLGTNSVR